MQQRETDGGKGRCTAVGKSSPSCHCLYSRGMIIPFHAVVLFNKVSPVITVTIYTWNWVDFSPALGINSALLRAALELVNSNL